MSAALLALLAVQCDGVAFLARRLAQMGPALLPYPRAVGELQRLEGSATDWANLARDWRREAARLGR